MPFLLPVFGTSVHNIAMLKKWWRSHFHTEIASKFYNYKEMASNIILIIKCLSRKTEIDFPVKCTQIIFVLLTLEFQWIWYKKITVLKWGLKCSLLVLAPLVSFSIKATAVGYPSTVFEIMKGTSRAFEVPTKPPIPAHNRCKTRRRDNAILMHWVWVLVQFRRAECVWGGSANWPTLDAERQCSTICMFSCIK